MLSNIGTDLLVVKGADFWTIDNTYRNRVIMENTADGTSSAYTSLRLHTKGRNGKWGYGIFQVQNAVAPDGDTNLNIELWKEGVGPTNAIRMTHAGNVAIGNQLPQEKLDVAGKVKIGVYTLPDTDGANGQVLTTNGAGTVGWQTPGGGLTGCAVTTNVLPGANTCSVRCPVGKKLVSGGCKYDNPWGGGQHEQIHASYPNATGTGWVCVGCDAGLCEGDTGQTCTAYVYCCN